MKSLVRPEKKVVQFLLGLANYFRLLIRSYAEIVTSLIELTKEKVKFQWKTTEQAFWAIPEAIIQNPTIGL